MKKTFLSLFFFCVFNVVNSQIVSPVIDYKAYKKGVLITQKYTEYVRVISECFPQDSANMLWLYVGKFSSGQEALLSWDKENEEIGLSYTFWNPEEHRFYRALNKNGNFVLQQNDPVVKKGINGQGYYVSGEELLTIKDIEDFLISCRCNIKPTIRY